MKHSTGARVPDSVILEGRVGMLEAGLEDALEGMEAMMLVIELVIPDHTIELQGYIDRAKWLLGEGP